MVVGQVSPEGQWKEMISKEGLSEVTPQCCLRFKLPLLDTLTAYCRIYTWKSLGRGLIRLMSLI